ncbi:baeRF2 domain-containing protein [Micromonospora sp. NBC_01796]|uniref:baeRF2 domain-containing protein n=1 Tax=Micromonospora sp. NBC_01796 TaxID=2975987 RepID=UPI002DD883C9|nr:Vms1/Ankzf1 family peptidyl-tRNA hydrolase [Micromonospora sp. NBC_01796]WSA85375.1 Vms1/Ankzf1 family peptidyl-tRNA hydrolase [Micromonospora sp. NBC_01796]
MELSFLRPIYARPGPWASVYLDASRDSQDARPALDLRWRALRERLAQQRADPATVAALDSVVRGHDPMAGDYGIAAFATDGEVVLTEYLSAPPLKDIAANGPLAHTMPLLAQRGEQVPWVRVLADRTGASVDGVSAGGVARRAEVGGGNTFPVRRVKPGAWSQGNFQRAALTAWKRNAGDAAAATAELADAVGAEVVVVAGDTQARTMLAAQLPARWQDRIVHTDAGFRAAGSDNSALDDVTVQAIAEVATAHADAALDKFGMQEQIGNGMDAVVTALQRSQVENMLLVHDASSTDQLWIGPEPTDIATGPDQLTAMSVADPQPVRADAALVRALVATDAGLTVLGPDEAPELPDGVGAILRYADASTPGRTDG